MNGKTLRGIITDAHVAAMRERDAERRQNAIDQLGGNYLMHPSNRTERATTHDATKAKSLR